MSTAAPCYDCPDRVPYCHSKCEKYLDYQEKIRAIRKAKEELYSGESDFRKVRSKKWRNKHG